MKNKNKNGFIYFCERKDRKTGYMIKQWLDAPCKGWRVLFKKEAHLTQTGTI